MILDEFERHPPVAICEGEASRLAYGIGAIVEGALGEFELLGGQRLADSARQQTPDRP